MKIKITLRILFLSAVFIKGFDSYAQSVPQDTLLKPPLIKFSSGRQTKGARVSSVTYDSPAGNVRLSFEVYDNALQYQAFAGGTILITNSNLGLKLSNGFDFSQNMKLLSTSVREINETISLQFNEKRRVSNHCKELTIQLAKRDNDSRQLTLIFRLYEEGIAFRYSIPAQSITGNVAISNELSEFSFVQSDLSIFSETATESGYSELSLNSWNSYNELPATLKSANFYCLINEADNQNYSRVKLYRNKNNTLTTQLVSGQASFSGAFQTPWRYVLFSKTAIGLTENKFLLYKLNAENKLGDMGWVQPGKVIRVMNLTTQSTLEYIDFAKSLGLQYILFDAGWYGLGYGEQFNAQSDPRKVIDEIDMPEVMHYAHAKGIGVLLYVNEVAFKNYNIDTFFSLYKSWGVKGIKLGFVEGRTQRGIAFQHEIIKKAADYKFILNIHDEYRPTGTSRTFPNLLTSEGIRGNEHRSNTAQHTTSLPFTRFLTGAGDYTVCFQDPNKQNSAFNVLQTTKAHQLAISVVFFSPLQHVLWYGVPQHYTNVTEIEFFKSVPTVWDDTKYLSGEIGKYVVVARRSGNKWFIAAMNGLTERSFSIPLNFLLGNVAYKAVSYEDSNGTIRKTSSDVSPDSPLRFRLAASSGKVFIIESDSLVEYPENTDVTIVTPDNPDITEPPLGTEEDLEKSIIVAPNPTNGYLSLKLPASFVGSHLVTITDLSGRILTRQWHGNQHVIEFDLSCYAKGVYIVSLVNEESKQTYQKRIVLQ